MASADHLRTLDLKAFDDTKAGVKGLVDTGITTIPSIFHHPLPHLQEHTDHHFTIPVIDLAAATGGTTTTPSKLAELVAAVMAAAETVGFFQVVNHGIPEETVEEMKRNVMGFFALPLAEKAAFAQRPGEIEGYGQAFVVSEEQTLDWADMFFLLTQPPSYRDLRLWPSNPSTFK